MNDIAAQVYGIKPLKLTTPRTQKGKSIYGGCDLLESKIGQNALRGYAYIFNNSPLALIQSYKDIEFLDPFIWKNKVFARPCPITPRHGFVDSRIIHNAKECKQLLTEVLAADKNGELVLTRFINKAVCSAVFSASGLLSIGPGHDGATAGKKSFSIPVKPENIWKLNPNIISESGLSKKDNVFIETVFTKINSSDFDDPSSADSLGLRVTQVRGGPSVKAVTDYVPKLMIVKKVVMPHNDLLAWESDVKKFSPGTVVYGKGHTLASHAGIHCVINKVPFITSFKPVIGLKIKPALNTEVKLNHRQFRLGTTLGFSKPAHIRLMFHTSVTILHNWAYLRNSEHASWLLGLSASYLVKVMSALNFGEYRHFVNKRYIKRGSVYKRIIKSNKIGLYMRKSPKVAATFSNKKVNKPAYGGVRWAAAVKATISIWNSLANIQKLGLTNTRANKLISQINKSINLIHNNGWLFNKISEQHCLNFITSNPGISALQMSDVLYDSYKSLNEVKRLRNINPVGLKKK
jgi:hypothetical protein